MTPPPDRAALRRLCEAVQQFMVLELSSILRPGRVWLEQYGRPA